MTRDSFSDLDPDQLQQLLSIGQAEAGSQADRPDDSDRGKAPDQTSQRLGEWINEYKLVGSLGEGGMAVVYLAEQEYPVKRQVALKLIKPGMDSKRVVARFEMERRALALLNHPNIAHIFDAGTTEDGRPYFVMEHVDGPPITQYCDSNKLSIDERMSLFQHICDAVNHAHQRGIIHRDIKPSNILVSTQEGQGVPKIIDFGVARATGSELASGTLLTEEGQLIGTPEYMSPEQVNLSSDEVDVRSDVYSLGALLYVLLTGALPFESEPLRKGGIDTIRRMITEQDPKTPSTRLTSLGELAKDIAERRRTEVQSLSRRLHSELEWIPLKAMQKERERRYQSAAELGQDIRNYLSGVPLIAGPPSTAYRLKKFIKRKRTLVSAVAVAVVALGIGLAASVAMYVRAEVQAEKFRAQKEQLEIQEELAQAVSGVLETALKSLDPWSSGNKEVTPVSTLDAVAETLEGKFENAPLMEAALRQGLGTLYYRHGKQMASLAHLERALQIYRNELGEDDPKTTQAIYELGRACHQATRLNKAKPLLLNAVERWTRQLGKAHTKTLDARILLAWTCEGLCQFTEAVELYRAIQNDTQTEGINKDKGARFAAYGRGNCCLKQHKYEDSVDWLGKAVELQRNRSSTGLTVEMMFVYGRALTQLKKYEYAESVLKKAFAMGREIPLGENSRQTRSTMDYMVRLYAAWGRLDEAGKWRYRLAAVSCDDVGSLRGSLDYDDVSGTYKMVGYGMGIGRDVDEFHFGHKTLCGDGEISARIESVEDVEVRTKAGLMIRDTLDPDSAYAGLIITPQNRMNFTYRLSAGEESYSTRTYEDAIALPHWIKLTRKGNLFEAWHSENGVNWEALKGVTSRPTGPEAEGELTRAFAEVRMNETAYIGMVVTSHNPGRTAEARFSDVKVAGDFSPTGPFTISEDITLLMASSETDVNIPPVSVDDKEPTLDDVRALLSRHRVTVGSVAHDETSNTYTMVGSGTDIWDYRDEFHFAWKTLKGDGSIVAQIESIQQADNWTKVGVMIRNALDANSENTMVLVTPLGRISFQHRKLAGSNCESTRTVLNAFKFPHWIRLTRKGDMFIAEHSSDGVKWEDIQADARGGASSVSIEMNQQVYVGLAVTSHAGPSVPAEAKISNVSVTGDVRPEGQFLWSEDIGFRVIVLPQE